MAVDESTELYCLDVSDESTEPQCTAVSALVFFVALSAGTGCTVVAKGLYGLTSVGMTGEVEPFHPPLFLTMMMFFGMAFTLPAHFAMLAYRHHKAKTDRAEAHPNPNPNPNPNTNTNTLTLTRTHN